MAGSSITGTTALASEIKPVYDSEFYMQAQANLFHDQLSELKEQFEGKGGSSYEWPLVANLPPRTAVLNELQDVALVPMSVGALSISLYEHGSAVQVTLLSVATSYADVYKQAAYANGYQLAESFDNIVRAVIGQGSMLLRQNSRTARTSFAGQATAADRITPSYLQLLVTIARGMKIPFYEDGSYTTLIHAFVHHDLILDSTIQSMAIRQTPEMSFNGEVGYYAGLRILVSANAKAFYGGGAVAASSTVTTATAAITAGDNTMTVASATNFAVGQWLAINDAEETGNTWSDTNELVLVTGIASTTITFVALDAGPGVNGGARYNHASGVTVKNNNSAYPVPILGPNSIAKLASSFTGAYGRTTVTGPFDYLGRFLAFGWYCIVGWGRPLEGWMLRGEVGSSVS